MQACYTHKTTAPTAQGFWRRVVEDGDQDTLYWDFAAGQIENVAAQLGIDTPCPDYHSAESPQTIWQRRRI
jgi:cytochrome c-type biogenesis protein CcmH